MCAQCGHVWLSAETTQAIDDMLRTPSAGRTSPGGSRLAVPPSKPATSPEPRPAQPPMRQPDGNVAAVEGCVKSQEAG